MSSASTSTSQPAPAAVLFARGVIARLSIWPVLRIAVQEAWGGPAAAQKRTWIASEILDAFENQTPLPDDQYIEELLLQIMADEFEVDVEDGSAESVAVDIVRIWEEVNKGKQDLVVKFEEMADKVKGKKIDAPIQEVVEEEEGDWEDDDEEDDDEEEEAPQLQPSEPRPPRPEPEVDEEGFTMVKGRSGRRH